MARRSSAWSVGAASRVWPGQYGLWFVVSFTTYSTLYWLAGRLFGDGASR